MVVGPVWDIRAFGVRSEAERLFLGEPDSPSVICSWLRHNQWFGRAASVTVSEVIAQQLAGVYRELADHHPFSEVARVELSAAAAWSRVERLLI